MKLHLDIGPFCWQLVTLLQPRADDEDSESVMELVELDSEPEAPRSMGFSANELDE